MLCISKTILIRPEEYREKMLNLTFKVTDFCDEAIFLKDNEGNEYTLGIKNNNFILNLHETPEERISYLEDMIVTLLEQLNLKEEDIHDLTFKRLYGDDL